MAYGLKSFCVIRSDGESYHRLPWQIPTACLRNIYARLGNFIVRPGNVTARPGNITARLGNITARLGNITVPLVILWPALISVRPTPDLGRT